MSYEQAKAQLVAAPRKWLVTGVAGFIGSHLLETLLELNQTVVGLDNLSTGHTRNLEAVQRLVSAERWNHFRFIEGDILDLETCRRAVAGVDCVLHEAALGSVPRSLAEPVQTHQTNVTGFVNLLAAAKEAGVERLIFASSSAVYGDDPGLPKIEDKIGKPLSPYAATKLINECYAEVFHRGYGLRYVGLRYFNVFGPRQDPAGAYAAVIPQWIAGLMKGAPVYINGDGQSSRDFCFVADVVQANLLAASTSNPAALNQVYNVARGEQTTLNELLAVIQSLVRRRDPSLPEQRPVYRDFRPGDVRHSLADITKARTLLGYTPMYSVNDGLEATLEWCSQVT